ncbi:MAG TPA: S-layer homology domain-containing protein [Chloroflexia bacterium]
MRYLRDRRGLVVVLTLLMALGITAGAMLVRWQGSSPNAATAFEPYIPQPGTGAGESKELHSMEDYWHTRVSYPTGRFDGRWLLEASQQDKLVQERVPAGRVIYNRGNGASPLALDPTSWTSLGPKPLESNGCINCFSYGHVSGRVNDIIIDPTNSTIAYLATVSGGVWKTTNCCTANTTWSPMTDDPLISTTSIDDLSMDPTNHNTIYAGTGDLNFGSFSMGSAGILKSTDAGVTWAIKGADVFTGYYPEPAGQFPQYQAVGKIEADPNNGNNLVAGTKTGVYFSYNGGDTWSGPCLTNSFSSQRQDVTGLLLSDAGSTTDMFVAVGARGYSTTVQYNLAENGANGIYKATLPASGCPATWSLITRSDNGWPTGTGSGIPVYQAGGNSLGRVDIDIAPSNPNYLYAIVQAIGTYQGGVKGVWRTTDGGATWAQRADIGSSTTDWAGCARTGQQNWYNQHIEIDPLNPEHVWVSTIDIFKSSNGGDTFTNITCGYNGGTTVHVDHHAIEFVPSSSDVLLAGSDGGAYVTLDATAGAPTFSRLNDSLSTIEFYGGDITANFANDTNPGANGGAQDNGSMVNVWNAPTPVGPALWQLRKGGDGMFARIEPVQELRWYQESQNGNLAVTTNGPYSSQVSATGGWTADRLSFVFPYEIYKYDCPPTGCNHLIAGSYRVWETITGGVGGASWVAISPDLTKNTLADRSFINQLSYAVSMSTTAIVGTNDGNVQYGFGLGTGSATANWVNVTGGNSVLPNRPILDVTTDPVTPTIGYAAVGGFDQNTPATPGHVYRVTCTANCASFTWENKSGNLPNIPVDSILANPRFPSQVFAGTDWGLYYTNDITAASPTWFRFQTGMPNLMIWDMSIDRGFTTLSVWTRGRGAFVWPLPEGPFTGGTPTPSVVPTVGTAVPTVTTAPSVTAIPSVTVAPTGSAVATGTATSVPQTATAVVSGTPIVATGTSTPMATTGTTTVVAGTSTSTVVATTTATVCPVQFTDVPKSNTFYSQIRCLACQGIMGGYSDGTFRPNNNITRGQLSKIVANSAKFADPVSGQAFEDVAPNSTFYEYIGRMAARGIIGGYPCGGQGEPCNTGNRPYFRPNANATRGQISKIVSEAAGIEDVPEGQTYQDVPPENTFYVWIERLTSRGSMSGYPCGGPGEPCGTSGKPYFRPNNNATRGQTSKIVANTFFPDCNPAARP